MQDAAKTDRWSHIFQATEEELVSSDIIGLPYASIADLKMTRVVGGNLVKVLAWYDNEMGYTNTLIEHVARAGKAIK
jgi:glyceraldehyde 3-phosphate dehydrogenase